MERAPIFFSAFSGLLAAGFLAGCGDDGGGGRADLGPFDVGFRTVDVTYTEAGTGEERTLPTQIWYPAERRRDDEQARYTVSAIVSVPTDVAWAEPAVAIGGPFPVAVYSHGSGGEGLLAYPYGELMASFGWIVIAPNHVGNTATDAFLGDGQDPTAQIVLNRPNDVSAMLDFLETGLDDDDPLAFQADTGRSLLFGHSFGGYSTFAAGGADVDFALLEAPCNDQEAFIDDCRFIRDDRNLIVCEDAEEPPPDCELFEDEALFDQCEDASDLLAACDQLRQPSFITAFEGEFLDPRFDAIVPQAPALVAFGEGELASIELPMLLQTGRRDQTTTQETSARPAWERTDGRRDVWIDMPDAGHFSFLTICTDLDRVIPAVNERFGLDDGTTLLEGLQPGAVDDGCGPSFTPSTAVVDALARYTLAWGQLHVLGDAAAADVFEEPPLVDGFRITRR